MAGSLDEVAAAILKDRSGVGAAELLVIGVALSVVFALRDENLLSRSDLLIIAATALAFALPFRLAAIVPLTAVALKLMFRSDPRLSSIGQLLLALAFLIVLGRRCSICCRRSGCRWRRRRFRPCSPRSAGSRGTG